MKPVDHQPVQELVAALKSDGQTRVAQGMANIPVRDAQTGELTSRTETPVMVTANAGAKEWTFSIVQNQTTGSTLLVGGGLDSSPGDGYALPSFDRQKVAKNDGPGFYPDEIQKLHKAGYRSLFRGQVFSMLGSAFEMASVYSQRDIEEHILDFTVDGERIRIAQGDLRRTMEKRVAALEREKAELERKSGDSGQYESKADKKYSGPDFHDMKPVFAEVLAGSNGAFCVLVVDKFGRCAKIAAGKAFSKNP